MIPGDARFDRQGWHYGVRFHDGSVAHPWNGATQRERAEAYIKRLRAELAATPGTWPDTYTLVRQRLGRPWQEVP